MNWAHRTAVVIVALSAFTFVVNSDQNPAWGQKPTKEKDIKDKAGKDKAGKANDHKDKDHKDKDHKEKDHKDKAGKDKGGKAGDSKDKGGKVADSKGGNANAPPALDPVQQYQNSLDTAMRRLKEAERALLEADIRELNLAGTNPAVIQRLTAGVQMVNRAYSLASECKQFTPVPSTIVPGTTAPINKKGSK